MDLPRSAYAHRNRPNAPVPGSWDYCYPIHPGVAHLLAFITCPAGHTSMLSARQHQVGAGGVVSPSYVCPYGCTFHVSLRLVGWDAAERAPHRCGAA